jgi:plastocyanin
MLPAQLRAKDAGDGGLMRQGRTRRLVLVTACLVAVSCAEKPSKVAEPSPASPTPDCSDLTGDGPAEILMHDNSFDPICAMVSPDQEIHFRNEGVASHTFTVEAADIDVKLLGGEEATAGTAGELLGPGEHEYVCRFHGGMRGFLEVA